jgi:hypothetical protein
MRQFLFTLVSFVVVTVAAPSGATVMNFTGEMFIRIGQTIPPATLTGSGTASLQQTAGGKVTQLTIPQGFFSKRTFLPVPNAFPIIQVVLTAPLVPVTEHDPQSEAVTVTIHTQQSQGTPVMTRTRTGLTNQSIRLATPLVTGVTSAGVCNPDPAHLVSTPATPMGGLRKRGIKCPGGGLAGFGGLGGSALVGLFFAPVNTHTVLSSFNAIGTLVHSAGSSSTTGAFVHTKGSQATHKPDFAQPIQNLAVPLSKVGEGSMTTVTGGGIRVTVSGAGWTTRTASIYNPTNHPEIHIPYTFHFPTGVRASRTVVPSQSIDNAAVTGTTEMVTGSQGTTGMGKLQIQLVSPVQVLNNATDEYSNTIVEITLTQAPEPGATALFFGGMGAVSLLYGMRRRRK